MDMAKIKNKSILTATQKNHIGLLQETYVELLKENIDANENHSVIKDHLKKKNGLVDFNPSTSPLSFWNISTRTKIEQIQKNSESRLSSQVRKYGNS